MAGATTQLVLSLQPGPPHAFGPVSVPAGVTVFNIQLSREDLNLGDPALGTVFQLALESSIDGGQTWQPRDGFGAEMGVTIDRHTGLPTTFSGGNVSVPLNSLVRGTITVTQPFGTTLTVTTS